MIENPKLWRQKLSPLPFPKIESSLKGLLAHYQVTLYMQRFTRVHLKALSDQVSKKQTIIFAKKFSLVNRKLMRKIEHFLQKWILREEAKNYATICDIFRKKTKVFLIFRKIFAYFCTPRMRKTFWWKIFFSQNLFAISLETYTS